MTHSEIIDLWPSLAEFARDLCIPYGTAKAMRRRDSIPAQYWNAVVAYADHRAISNVDLQVLADAVSITTLLPVNAPSHCEVQQ
ncbi:hypothetical protein [Pseudochrobactrum sp. HB0163]|uniref:hypothetical protein n=1 Tax=Pseudochrobactrum sp. HB0163 TaxID=3450708 RepID=UPI003F6E1092